MPDKYDLQRYKGTTRENDAKVTTPFGDVELKFFEVDEANIQKDLQHQAADFVFFATKEVLFETKLMTIRSDMNALRSSLWSGIVEGHPKLRIRDIEAKVESDQTLIDLRKQEIELDHAYRIMVNIRKAFDMKSRMIQSSIGLMRSSIDKQIESNRAELSEKYHELVNKTKQTKE
jgi:hypothetical protein